MVELSESSKIWRPLRVSLIGSVWAIVSSVLTLVVSFALLAIWLPPNADFGTNGSMWAVVAIAFFDMIAVPAFLLVVLGIVIPLRYKKARENPPNRLHTRLVISVTLLLELIACTLFTWGAPLVVIAIANGPNLVVTGIATILFLNKLNANLSSYKLPSEGPTDGPLRFQ